METVRNDRRSIRFQLSTLLLISTLNGLAYAGAAVILFRTLAAGPGPVVGAIRSASQTLTGIHNQATLMALSDDAEGADRNRPLAKLDEMEAHLRGFKALHGPLFSDIAQYRKALERWIAFASEARAQGELSASALAALPRASGASEADETDKEGTADLDRALLMEGQSLSEEGRQVLENLNRSYRQLLGELLILSGQHQTTSVEQYLPFLPWAMAYILAMALATLVMALRIRTILSAPLQSLRTAAATVSSGAIETPIPPLHGATELEELSRSLEKMREKLVNSIRDLDSRNDELASILNSLTDGVMVVDKNALIKVTNPRACEILRGREGNVAMPEKGVGIVQVFPQLDTADIKRLSGEEIEFSLPLANGKSRHVLLRLQPIRGHTFNGDTVVVVRDTTREHEIEQMKRDFLSVITHELKTPLTSIEGYTKLLMMGKGGKLTEKQRQFMETIVEQTMALKQMIQNLLDSTRLEGSTLPIHPSVVDVSEELRTAWSSMKGSAQMHGIELTLDISKAEGVQIEVDPFRLQQIIGNLMSNALKFTPKGGRISLSARLDGDDVVIEVEDTGRGIPEEAIPQLFNKFYQVAQGDTRVAGGAGLGLFICKQLVEVQGGTINVVSRVGQGSRFIIRFPRYDLKRGASETKSGSRGSENVEVA